MTVVVEQPPLRIDARKPTLFNFRSSRTMAIITVSGAVFSEYFTYGMLLPILPFSLVVRTGSNANDTQRWISIMLSTFGASFFLSALIIGTFASRIRSTRIPFLLGLLALSGSNGMFMAGNSIAILIVGRVLQGLSAAITSVVGMALLVDTLGADSNMIGQAMGHVGLAMSVGFFCSSLLAGIVFARVGYYPVFAMAFALIGVDAGLRFSIIDRGSAAKWLDLEVVEQLGLGKVEEVSTPDVNESRVSSSIVLADDLEKGTLSMECKCTAYNTFDLNENKIAPNASKDKVTCTCIERINSMSSTSSIEPTKTTSTSITFKWSARLLTALWTTIMLSAIMSAFDSVLPAMVHDTFRWKSTGAGIVFLPFTLGSFAGPLMGWMCDRWGPRCFATVGFMVGGTGLVILRLVTHDNMREKVILFVLLSIISLGLTLVLTPVMAEIAYAVDEGKMGDPDRNVGKNGGSSYLRAYGFFNSAWAFGSIFGPLLAGLVRQRLGWSAATLILGCLSIVSSIPTAIWTGGSIFRRSAKCNGETEILSNITTAEHRANDCETSLEPQKDRLDLKHESISTAAITDVA